MLRLAILVIILVLVLSFFGVSLQHIVESPTSQSNFGYVGTVLSQGWHDILGILTGLLNSVTHIFQHAS